METVTGSQWRVVFTGFDGSMTGNVELGKLLVSGTDVSENVRLSSSTKLFPNPAACETVVTVTSESSLLRVTVWGINGQKVKDINVRSQSFELSTTGMEPGMYLLQVESLSGSEVIRLTVQ
jgi:hypothetical protein